MRLSELQKPDEVSKFKREYDPASGRAKWRHSLDDFMAKYGFKWVGHGEFGSVFISPKYPFALKVFRDDSNYIRWLKFCKANPDNPYLVKTKGALIRIVDDVYAIRIEKLQSNGLATLFADAFESLVLGEESPSIQKCSLHLDSDEYLKQAIDFLKPFKFQDHLDLHAGNIMFRGVQPVIIDPLSSFGVYK